MVARTIMSSSTTTYASRSILPWINIFAVVAAFVFNISCVNSAKNIYLGELLQTYYDTQFFNHIISIIMFSITPLYFCILIANHLHIQRHNLPYLTLLSCRDCSLFGETERQHQQLQGPHPPPTFSTWQQRRWRWRCFLWKVVWWSPNHISWNGEEKNQDRDGIDYHTSDAHVSEMHICSWKLWI